MLNDLRLSWHLKHLKSGTPAEQASAAHKLGDLKDPRTVEPLMAALDHADKDVRQAAARALGLIKDLRAVARLVRMVVDSEPTVRAAAAEALWRLRQSDWKEWVRGDDEDFARLGKSGDKRVLDALIQGLQAGERPVREACARALGVLGLPRAIWPLTHSLGSGDNSAAAEALCALKAAAPLMGGLKHNSEVVRQAAARALGEMKEKEAAEPLLRTLVDKNWEVRRAVVEALGRLGDKRAAPFLIPALEDTDRDVREAAAVALGLLGDPQAVTPLLKALGEGEFFTVRQAAARSLAALGEPKWQELVKGERDDFLRLGASGDPRVLPALLKALKEPYEVTQQAAAEALSQINDKSALEPLVKALSEPEPLVRRAAIMALGRMGDQSVVPALVSALRDSVNTVRQAAADSLGVLADPQALEGLLRALGDADGEVRVIAAAALREVGQPNWEELIQGNAEDFARLGKSGEPQATVPLIQALGDGDGATRKAAAEALGALGEENWKNLVTGELEDFKRLGQSGDARVVESLLNAVVDARGEVRRAAAEGLALLDKPQWQESVRGEYADFARLAASGEVRALQVMLRDLSAPGRDARKAAAQALVTLVTLNPKRLGDKWLPVSQRAKEQHADHTDEAAANVSGNKHTDQGIGVEFPEPPEEFRPKSLGETLRIPLPTEVRGKTEVASAPEVPKAGTWYFPCPFPECGKRIKVPLDYPWKKGRCPACGRSVDIPARPKH